MSRSTTRYPFNVSRTRLVFGIVWCVALFAAALGRNDEVADVRSPVALAEQTPDHTF